jgi:hypothetical protein
MMVVQQLAGPKSPRRPETGEFLVQPDLHGRSVQFDARVTPELE